MIPCHGHKMYQLKCASCEHISKSAGYNLVSGLVYDTRIGDSKTLAYSIPFGTFPYEFNDQNKRKLLLLV